MPAENPPPLLGGVAWWLLHGRVSFVVLPIISPVITSAVRGTKSKIACFFQKNQFDIAKEKVPSPGVRISKGWLYSIGLQARLSVVWNAWSYTKI